MTILQIFFYDCYQLSNLLQTSPQPSSGDHFRPKYTLKRDFGPICPNMVIWTQTPQKIKMLKFYFFIVISLVIRFQWALNHDLEIILTQDIDLFPIFHPFSPLKYPDTTASTLQWCVWSASRRHKNWYYLSWLCKSIRQSQPSYPD